MDADLFEFESFDAIVSVSAIEHVGLGAYDQDPLYDNGDMVAMLNASRWLKTGGWMYLDVPYRDDHYAEYKNFRAYNDAAIERRLLGWRLKIRMQARCEVSHPDGPFMAMLLEKV